MLGKLVWRPAEGAEVSLKYGYTKGEDSHFASLIAPELNCYLPVPGTESEPWYATSTGWYCGEFKAEGRENRINLPDFRQGVTYILANNFPNPEDFVVPPTKPGTFREQNRVLLEYVQDRRGLHRHLAGLLEPATISSRSSTWTTRRTGRSGACSTSTTGATSRTTRRNSAWTRRPTCRCAARSACTGTTRTGRTGSAASWAPASSSAPAR